MLGARSSVETAVGSRPKLNTVRTRAVNTSAETIAVRDRNSSVRSLRAMVQACRHNSRMVPPRLSYGANVRVRDFRRPASTPRLVLHEPAAQLKSDVRRQLRPFIHVVRREHDDPARAAQGSEKRAELPRGGEVQAGEGLVEEEHLRIVNQRLGDCRALHQTARERPRGLFGSVRQAKAREHIRGTSAARAARYAVQRGPEEQILAHAQVSVQMRLMTDPPDRGPAAGHTSRPRLRS